MNKEFMKMCIEEAIAGVKAGHGGPFGALIVKDGEIVSLVHNTVLRDNDPTAHGEVNAIRAATKKLGRFDLSDCELYTSAEPCPMCLSAIMWAGIKKVYYGCTAQDTEDIGFADKFIYDYIKGETETNPIELEELLREECLDAFKEWSVKDDKTPY